jgi:hypothetical protein
MYSPRARTGRKPVGVKPIAAALAVALMGMGGVALAAPKADSGPTEPGQGNGPPPQAQGDPAQPNAPAPQAGAPAPQAQDPAPPPQAKAKGRQVAGTPAQAPAQPPQAGGESNQASPTGQDWRNAGDRGRPAQGENRGQGESRSTRARSGGCHSAGCRQGPKPVAGPSSGGGEQPQPAGAPQGAIPGDVPGGSGEQPYGDDHGGAVSGEDQAGAADPGSVLGANQGGGEEVEASPRSFDTALPFTGFEVVLLAGIGALLWLAGVRLRRSTA